MKKIWGIGLVLGLLLGFCPGRASAYTQTLVDHTLVQASGSGSGYIQNQWYDIVGSTSAYQLAKTAVTWSGADVKIVIYTNTYGNRISGDYVADVALDLDQDGIWETGIVLSNADRPSFSASTMYTRTTAGNNTHWQVSNDFPGGVWGKKYDRSNNPIPSGSHTPYDPPVRLKSGYTYASTPVAVAWLTEPPGSDTTHRLQITLTGVNSGGLWDAFDLLWGTQTCANDTQYASFQNQHHTPVPASVLLLGTGLAGLLALGRRRRWR